MMAFGRVSNSLLTIMGTSITLILLLSMSVQALTISVYSGESIQKAIDRAFAGDVVRVHSGVYKEALNVTKKIVLKGVDLGKGRPILTSGDHASIVTLFADGVVMSGFILKGANDWSLAGINIASNKNVIKDNIVTDNSVGIRVTTDGNTITGNNVSDNYLGGIVLTGSHSNPSREIISLE